MHVWIILYVVLLVYVLYTFTNNNKEHLFDWYEGMPGIDKTFVSPHFVLNQFDESRHESAKWFKD